MKKNLLQKMHDSPTKSTPNKVLLTHNTRDESSEYTQNIIDHVMTGKEDVTERGKFLFGEHHTGEYGDFVRIVLVDVDDESNMDTLASTILQEDDRSRQHEFYGEVRRVTMWNKNTFPGGWPEPDPVPGTIMTVKHAYKYSFFLQTQLQMSCKASNCSFEQE
jgi:hypothetical protein